MLPTVKSVVPVLVIVALVTEIEEAPLTNNSNLFTVVEVIV